MRCNCKVVEILLAIVFIVLALVPELIGAELSKWIIVIAAVLLLLHAFGCNECEVSFRNVRSKRTRKKKKR